LPVPAEYGGAGQDLTTTILAMEALGYACRDDGLVFSLNAQMWAFELPLVRFGSEDQKRRYLPALCRGDLIGAHAVTEPDFGSDAMSMASRYGRDGDDYVLDGTKTFVTNGPVADVILAFASMDRGLKAAGLSAFLVDRGTPGMALSDPIPKMGLRTSPMGEVAFSGCRVPAGNRLGSEGAGVAIFNAAMEWERAEGRGRAASSGPPGPLAPRRRGAAPRGPGGDRAPARASLKFPSRSSGNSLTGAAVPPKWAYRD
jgi:alkylation response protein AidB-like acyl-CoA dehydrogenase